jgi:hypothetical protein
VDHQKTIAATQDKEETQRLRPLKQLYDHKKIKRILRRLNLLSGVDLDPYSGI